jgi:hypothetical protein
MARTARSAEFLNTIVDGSPGRRLMERTVLLNYVVIGSDSRSLPPGMKACRLGDLSAFIHDAPKKTVCIAGRRNATEAILKVSLRAPQTRMAELLTLEPPRSESVPVLLGIFDRVVGAANGHAWLPMEQLLTVVVAGDATDRFIAGAVDSVSRTVALVRGDRSTVLVPFSYFHPAGDGAKPDFKQLALNDYGNTIRLGDYEASADGILYEHDADYRRRAGKARRDNEQSFGASLRRLRIQRRLRRSDFPEISTKTIARIERNEISKPRGKTLEALAARLGVGRGDIETY